MAGVAEEPATTFLPRGDGSVCMRELASTFSAGIPNVRRPSRTNSFYVLRAFVFSGPKHKNQDQQGNANANADGKNVALQFEHGVLLRGLTN